MPGSDWLKSPDVIRANDPRLTIREISVSPCSVMSNEQRQLQIWLSHISYFVLFCHHSLVYASFFVD